MYFNRWFRFLIEKNSRLLQPIPVAIITNKEKSKILVIKKNKNAVSNISPEKDKVLLYIGGHSRYEDTTETISHDFLSVCRSTLKREIKEEIGIAVALNDIIPKYIYFPTNERSEKHLAVCFVVPMDDEGIKLRLDQHELILNKGRSKSGKFLKIKDLQKEQDLEDWSITILEHFFNIKWKKSDQVTIFNYEV